MLAAAQHGVVARRQLLSRGLRPGLIDGRLVNGRLLPVLPGVYTIGTGQLGREGRWMAAALGGGQAALLSHRSAAALHGLIEPGAHEIEVIHFAPRRKTLVSIDRPGTHRFSVLVHCTRWLPPQDFSDVSGIPVTSVARTLVDLAGIVGFRRLRSALVEAERLRIMSRPDLDEVIGRGRGWSGVRNLRLALAEMDPDDVATRSDLELEMLSLCRDHGISAPAVNVPIGRYVADFHWPKFRLIVEVDGFASHGKRPAFRYDRNRDVDLMLAGHRVARFTHEDVFEKPTRTAQKLKALLANRP
ncbi:MAG TPA: DUF559 domain-containing protein [Solirubrobacterales bacterium]|nr:DUF559 domain-containing protein [Solirubrobacterales bacterium]